MNTIKKQLVTNNSPQESGFSNVRAQEKSSHHWYSPVQLSNFGLKNLPLTPKGIREMAKRRGWKWRRVPGRGGRDGMRDEFQPPPDVQLLIDEAERRSAFYRSDEGLKKLTADSPPGAYDAMRRVRDAADTLHRLKAEVGYQYSPEWGTLLLELLAGGQLTEHGAQRLIAHLKWISEGSK